jgi:hypothetical protein
MASYSVSIASAPLGQPAGNIRFSLARPLDCTRGVWECALSFASVWYSWYNVSASAYGNSTFSFSDGTTTYTCTLRDGSYNAQELIDAINVLVLEQAPGTNPTDLVLAINQPTLGFTLTLDNDYELDLSAGGASSLWQLFGADPVNYTLQDTLIFFPRQANIDFGRSVLTIRAPGLITSNTLNGEPSNILYAITPNLPPGSLLAVQPPQFVWNEVPNGLITSISLQVQDGLGRIVDFNNGADNVNNGSAFTLIFRERK